MERKGSGIGTMNKRNRSGKSAARNAPPPKNKAKAPSQMHTTANTKRDWGFVAVRCQRFTWDAVSNIAPGASSATANVQLDDTFENTDFRFSKIKNALTNGISGI